MKLNALLCSAVLATSMVTVAHADNTTHVAAASALGSSLVLQLVKAWVVHLVQQLVLL